MLTLASLFDGISGFPLAAKRAGIETAWSAEIDPQCRSVSARHFPDAIQINNVIAARAMLEAKTRGRFATELSRSIDVLCGGFPCQDLSVAGRRAGLAGSRSGLWFVFRRILGIVRPRWVCIENVPGLLSSNEGRDMRVIADALGQLGYGWAMRVLDAQWCGVPQRRRRVFIVGCLGDGRRAAEVLFEHNCLPWDSPPSREARTRVADCITAGVAASRGVNRPGRRREDDFNLVAANCLDAHMGMGGVDDNSAQANHLVPVLSHTLTATATATGRLDPNGETFIPIALDWMAGESGNDDSFKGKSRKWITRAGDYTGAIGATKRDGVCDRYGVRRLTPLECERLQGFPDGWTQYGHDGKEMSDSARYRMLGNSVAVPCVEWFMRRIAERSI